MAELLRQKGIHVWAAVDDRAAKEGWCGAGENEADDKGGNGDGIGVVEGFNPGMSAVERDGCTRGTICRGGETRDRSGLVSPLTSSWLRPRDSPTPLNPRIILLAHQIPQIHHEIIHLDIRQRHPPLLPMLVPYLSPLSIMRTPPRRTKAVVKI